MAAGRVGRGVAIVVAVAVGSAAALADDPAKQQQEEALRRLRAAQLQLQLRAQPKQKAQPKTPAKPLPPAAPGMPDGALARLGDSRLRHAAKPLCVAFSSDGTRVFTGGEDGTLRTWDVATGQPLKTLSIPSGYPVSVTRTHGGKQLTLAFAEGRVRFLNPDTLAEEGNISYALGGDFALSADGSFFAAFNGSGFLTVFEVGTELPKLELPPNKPFAFHPNGKSVASADKEGKVTLYMLAGGKPLATFDHGAAVGGVAFSPNGRRLATGGNGKTVRVWDVSDPKKPPTEIPDAGKPKEWLDDDRLAAGDGFTAGVYDVAKKEWAGRVKGVTGEWAVSPDGRTVAATGTGLRVRLFDLGTGKELHAENDTFPDVTLLLPTADGKAVFMLTSAAAFLWPLDKPTATPAGTLPGKATAAAAGDGRLAVATPDGVLVYDDFDPTKPLPAKPSRTLAEHATNARTVAVSPDGKKVAYCGDDRRTVIANAATGKTVRVLPAQTLVLALAFSPDSKRLAFAGRDGFLRLWAAAEVKDGPDDGDFWKTRLRSGPKAAVAFSADGKHLVATSSGQFKVLTAADGAEVFAAGGIYDNGIFQDAAFTPDGRFVVLASEGESGGVYVWEVATQSLVRRFSTGFGTVRRVSVFPGGTKAVSAGAEEAITVWELTTRLGKPAPTAERMWQHGGR